MLCSQMQFRRQYEEFTDVALLPCRSWGCEYCSPKRKNQLKAIAASGSPNVCLTLTVNTAQAETPAQRYSILHAAWKNLVKRILRQFALPEEKRWVLRGDEGCVYQEILSYRITSQVKPGKVRRLHYMAFVEETEAGEPHLHILMRTKYIPQRWISQQMAELINSPIVWIEKVKGTRAAISYVTKYVTDAPMQYGKSKRYWVSRRYRLIGKNKPDKPVIDRKYWQRVPLRFNEFIKNILQHGLIPIPQAREQLRLYTLKNAAKVYRGDQPFEEHPDILRAYMWLATYRRMCAL